MVGSYNIGTGWTINIRQFCVQHWQAKDVSLGRNGRMRTASMKMQVNREVYVFPHQWMRIGRCETVSEIEMVRHLSILVYVE